jgi:DNA primase
MNKYEKFRQENELCALMESHGVSLHNSSSLEKRKHHFTGQCPFHDDYNNSLQVNANRQSWLCRVCDIGGDSYLFDHKMNNRFFEEGNDEDDDDYGEDVPV